MKLSSFVLAVVTLGATTSVLSAQARPTYVEDASESITEADLRARIGTLAHDSMRGRDTPSPELERTARYVEEKFRAFGLQPGAGSGFVQRYPITVIRPGPAEAQSVVLRGPDGVRLELSPDTDFVSVPVGPNAAGDGDLIVVSSDDRETDVAGKVVVLHVTTANSRQALGSIREFQDGRKAEGAIMVMAATPEYVDGLRRYFGYERVSLGEPAVLPAPVMIVAESTLPESLVAAIRGGQPLDGWSARLRSEADVEAAEGVNTVGWLEGSDPDLKDEYVVFSAHMDHVGVGRPVAGDSIYNGADDNASGTAAVIELAQAFAETAPRPRRSMIFLLVSGEEKGLWGSRWYADNPTFPIESTVANINIDMIGRNWTDSVVAIGKEESTLGASVERVAADHPELGVEVVDDQWPDERFYYRSDHYNFARQGVPILFFFTGTHEDYHRPSDEPERIGYEKMTRITRLLYYLGLDVANAPEKPEWDEAAYQRVVEGGS
jgi:hypothetical protein